MIFRANKHSKSAKQEIRKLNPRTLCLYFLLSCFPVFLFSCQRSQVDSDLTVTYPADDVEAELDYWHGLADRPVTSNDEALHGLILFANGTDPNDTYDARVQWLQDKGYLARDFDRPADETAARGTIAQVLCHVLEIEGGMTMRLLGPHPRYATRELVYLDILPPSSQQQGLSGIQFVGVISRAEAYQEGKP